MELAYGLHIAAGGISLVAGYLALLTVKGMSTHRAAGIAFFYAMLTMSVLGTVIAIVRGVAPALNVPAGVLTAYLVITGTTAVRKTREGRWLAVTMLIVGGAVGVITLVFGLMAVSNERGTAFGMPAFPFLMFGAVGILAAVLDYRRLGVATQPTPTKIARHLWRMCFALFIASLSFFIGQSKVFPEPIRIMPLLATPMILVLLTMFYWLWRVRVRRILRGISVRGAPSAA